MSDLKTPLNEWHYAHGAKTAPFAGWDMPIQYEGILVEHTHTRENASIFDICHMGQIFVSGKGAKERLAKAVTHNLDTLATGKCRYGFLLTEKGTVIDDLIIYNMPLENAYSSCIKGEKSDEQFLLVVNASCTTVDLKAITERVGAEFVQDVSDQFGKIDLQGPKSLEVLERVFEQNFHDLAFFSFVSFEYHNIPIFLSRTGYTGDLGYELYFPREFTVPLWEALSKDDFVKPAGLGARDTLRLESGFALYGHEIDDKHTVAESGFGAMLNSEVNYVGKEKAKTIPNEVLVGLQLEGRRTVRNGDTVLLESGSDTQIGTVASGSFSPSLGYAIAFAFVKKEFADKEDFVLKAGRSELFAKKVDIPFYKNGTARIKLT